MNAVQAFKQAVERECAIVAWTPTTQQLHELANSLVRGRPRSMDDARALVDAAFPNVPRRLTEGVDNSDLKTLLVLALAAASAGPKG